MSKLTDDEISMIRLIERSPDRGNGWRAVSDLLWPMVRDLTPAELVEFDTDQKRVRFNADGAVLARYL